MDSFATVRRSTAEFDTHVPLAVNEALTSPGQQLEPAVRATMESRFGYDFSSVKIHTDPRSRTSAESVRALAYTVNDDIVVGRGAPDLASEPGHRLLAHELAHIVQRQETGTAAHPSPARADADAERVATEFSAGRGPLRVSRVAPGVLARQAIPGSQPAAPNVQIVSEAGRSVVLLDGVPIAETHAATKDIVVRYAWTPDRMAVRVLVPEGHDVFLIRSTQATAVLQAAATRYRIEVGTLATVPAPSTELQSQSPSPDVRITDSISGERPKAPARAPALPPKPAPKPAEPVPPAPAPSQAPTGPPIQLFRPSAPSLDLPPAAKYGRPTTEGQIAEERIRGIVRDAMAGKPGLPPPITGVDRGSLLDIVKRAVTDAVKPLIGGLPKDVQKLVLDKLNDAVEAGITSVLETTVDATKLDAVTKGAILRAAEAGLRVK